jgi:hypothetical protein
MRLSEAIPNGPQRMTNRRCTRRRPMLKLIREFLRLTRLAADHGKAPRRRRIVLVYIFDAVADFLLVYESLNSSPERLAHIRSDSYQAANDSVGLKVGASFECQSRLRRSRTTLCSQSITGDLLNIVEIS